ncbi:MAG: pantothenate kinase [Leptolyngbya sp. SIO3F4]|nr:pantothenate kinase [Leptolyngbya sp. SIO3F4]
MANWLALVIGNTRWHWGWFNNSHLKQVWHTEHLSTQPLPAFTLQSLIARQAPSQLLQIALESLEVWAVSVVPPQDQYLQSLSSVHWVTQFPIKDIYPTMGLDRVATLLGAGHHYNWPVLVIDAGTALTFTAGVDSRFLGGAISLGLRSHLIALHDYTAALPQVGLPKDLPTRWASSTSGAIQSGVIHTALANVHHFIQSWQHQYPETNILFTGGDGQYLYELYREAYPTKETQTLTNRIWVDSNLMFWGISAYRSEATRVL